MEFTHKPVLLAECIEALHIRPEGIYVDGTLGRAGHSREIAQRLTTGRLVCIDRDQAAIDAAQERLAPWMDRAFRSCLCITFSPPCSPPSVNQEFPWHS